jgi:hypothetical protein
MEVSELLWWLRDDEEAAGQLGGIELLLFCL